MSTPLRLVLIALAAAAAGWMAWRPVRGLYLEPRRALLDEIASHESRIASARDAIADRPRVLQAIGGYAERTLGGDLETVDHRLRTHLNRIGEAVGLAELSVGTSRNRRLESPAAGEFRGKLRDEIDAVEVEAWINGRGTLEQALRTVHRLEAEPWLKRIGQVRLQARDNGESFVLNVRLTTLFLPGRSPEAQEWPYDPAGFEAHRALLARNPFALPPPAPPPVVQEAAAAPKPPPRFPWGDWMLTGVLEGPGGPEAWLRNVRSGETRRLGVGEALDELVLAALMGDAAEFSRGGAALRVEVGQTLAAAAAPRHQHQP